MSVSYINESIKFRLWGKAAGRCQYEGCNKPLWIDPLTKGEFNSAYIAHIIADKPNGPRGHQTLSEKLKSDISNLMILCDTHHRLIDKIDVKGHPVNLLQNMKKSHEERIEVQTSIQKDRESHILMYGANVGEHSSPICWEKCVPAIIPEMYPSDKNGIILSLKNSHFRDNEDQFWKIESTNLNRQFNKKIKPLLESNEIKHLSVFGLAPQPLLIELGRLLSDIPSADIYQLHREPPNWLWQSSQNNLIFEIHKPLKKRKTIALNLSLSASISNGRIEKALGPEISIWTITTKNPNNDFLKSRNQLSLFRKTFRSLLNKIKFDHPDATEINIFPAVPVSIAIEIGRVWMPKADLPLNIYDENRSLGGFLKTLTI